MTTISSKPPAITVLMACYNAARWLDVVICSVLGQSFKDFEFIIVDDGSADETLKIINRHAMADLRIVVIAKSNTGLADSLNVGILKARGKWIARIDADDLCDQSRLEKQFELGMANSKIVFIGSGFYEIDQYGNRMGIHKCPTADKLILRELEMVRKSPPHSSAFFLTKAAHSIGGYRTRLVKAQDLDLWLRLSELGELAGIEEPLVQIRKHSGQISNFLSGRPQMIDARVAVTSYFLRQMRIVDPVVENESNYQYFREWIAKEIEDDGVYVLLDFRQQLIDACHRSPNLLIGSLNILQMAAKRPGIMWRYILHRLMGESLPRRLAQKWGKRTVTDLE
ncbi:MAG: glycosyltransferase [Chloroflexota bacterium]